MLIFFINNLYMNIFVIFLINLKIIFLCVNWEKSN